MERLLKLADHLERGELGHNVFYFGWFNSGLPGKLPRHQGNRRLRNCAQSGCGIGECPFIWPSWAFNDQHLPVYENLREPSESAQVFFQLDLYDYQYVFIPSQKPKRDGKIILKSATREDVARHIREFCKFAEQYR